MRARLACLVWLAACGAGEGAGPSDGAPGLDAASPPTWSTELASADTGLFDARHGNGSSAALGVADGAAGDGLVASLVLAGDPALGPGDDVGPDGASEIATQRTFSYGTFRQRVRLASCGAGEDAVNGLFLYANDGMDHDHNGIVDNHEIDIEILCGTPTVVFLSSWTDYDDTGGAFKKLTREIDLATGAIADSVNDHTYDLAAAGTDPALVLPHAIDPGGYVELGWSWHAGALRYFVVVDGREVTLWDLHDAAHVPSRASSWIWNVWHSDVHWTDGEPADYPAHDAELRIDRAAYWAD
jgi:hypothetical protein